MTAERIPVAGPWITDKEIAYVTDAVATNWYEQAGEYVSRFESAFAAHTGRAFAVSLPSCTAGLHLTLAALGIGPGDEVIVPELTWIASSAPVSYVGATPVFVDVDSATWCLTPASIRAALTDRTKAIIAVDLYGSMPDYPEIQRLADEHGITVIEDAAEAVGSRLGGAPAGAFGVASVFSFHGSKTLTTGEGGMLVTDDEELAGRVNALRDHGREPRDRTFSNVEVGFKYKMSSLQAALGLAQLERLDELVDRKRQLFSWYRDRLSGHVDLNAEPPGSYNSYWMVTAVVPEGCSMRTPALMAAFDELNIDTRPCFHPLSSIPAYAGRGRGDASRRHPVSYSVSPRGINLPSALTLGEEHVDRVASALIRLIDT